MSLKSQMAADLEGLFYRPSDFAVDATVGGVTLYGIFDAPSSEALGMGSTKPTFRCASENVAAHGIVQGTVIVIGGVTYKVTGIEPDGTGETVLGLREAE